MIKVSVEVREGDGPFRVAVLAESIIRAIGIIQGRHPGRDVRVVFPIDPEGFFAGDPAKTGVGQDECSQPLQDPVLRVL